MGQTHIDANGHPLPAPEFEEADSEFDAERDDAFYAERYLAPDDAVARARRGFEDV